MRPYFSGIAVFVLLLPGLASMVEAASIWIDAEDTTANNFSRGHVLAEMRADAAGAAGGSYMAVQRSRAVAAAPYFASYSFRVTKPGNYKIWLACSPQNAGWASPFYLQLDGLPFISLKGRPTLSKVYGLKPHTYFGWVNAGTYDLATGEHTLRLEVRDVRAMDDDYVAFLDSIWLTQDLAVVPEDIVPPESGLPSWQAQVEAKGFDPLVKEIRAGYYRKRLSAARERDGATSAADVVAKLKLRPLPGAAIRGPGPHEFGVHGMEKPFVRAGVDTEKIRLAYELLARAGVQSFRTAESCWHRLGENYDNFTELDYQVESAARYGMTQLLTVGYPPSPYRISTQSGLSAVKPEYREKYRDYLERLLRRYAGRGVIRYVELGNEVDAPNPWWRDSTPQMYVDEMKLVHEVTKRIEPTAQTVAFGATYSRREDRGGPDGGRRFIRKCLDLGIADYTDTWSIHYTWPLAERDFPAFIRREEAERSILPKPLLNTEEAGYGHPSDMLKLFARDFYVHGMPRVDYYLARDWYEAGTLIYSGLFDLDWNPKPRLLGYAAAVDAMQRRVLVGMLDTDDDREVYVLENTEDVGADRPRHAIVAWVNSPQIREFHAPGLRQSLPGLRRQLDGLNGEVSAMNWNLDPLPLAGPGVVEIGQYPVIIFTDTKPDWPLISGAQWLEKQAQRKADAEALVPVR
ncbi:hypothetical protein OPIT5_15175 [Opitutaceae bacterium TAV5]|nr:hypothetical protein OPIT5_15175 [Opitutaceae bacterium TAV5]